MVSHSLFWQPANPQPLRGCQPHLPAGPGFVGARLVAGESIRAAGRLQATLHLSSEVKGKSKSRNRAWGPLEWEARLGQDRQEVLSRYVQTAPVGRLEGRGEANFWPFCRGSSPAEHLQAAGG